MLPPHSFLRADVDLQTGLGPSACRRILGADRGVTGGIKRVEVGEVGKKGVDGKRLRRVGASPNSLGTACSAWQNSVSVTTTAVVGGGLALRKHLQICIGWHGAEAEQRVEPEYGGPHFWGNAEYT